MKYLLGAALLAAMVSPATATDTGARITAPAVDWTGFYVGGNIGGGGYDVDWIFIGPDSRADHRGDGMFGGAQLGYNWQVDNWVFGAEADFSYSDIDGGTPCPNPAFRCSSEVDWLASIRGRVGYNFDSLLVYATGGIGIGRFEFDVNDGTGAPDAKTDRGWAAGAGLEYALSSNWSIKAEYLHYDFGSRDYSVGPASEPIGTDLRFDTGKIGINYRF